MSNMSYCRFENTAGDLSDCLAQLRALLGDGDGPPERIPASNHQERTARIQLVELCLEVAELFDDANDANDQRAAITQIVEKAEADQEEGEDE